jgi:hypothetical protein
MADVDDDFTDFLKRRKPVFRSPDDLFEPPAELDRVVLRQAREAIESERTLRVFRSPRWATPVAVAATVLLTFTVLFHAGSPRKQAPVPEVSVQQVAQPVDEAAATPDWRRDSRSWLAQIEKLRAEGRVAEADAELAAYKREHRALAVSPDR